MTSENPLNEMKAFHEKLSSIMAPLKMASDFSHLFFKDNNDFIKEIELRWNYHNNHNKDYVSGITTGIDCLDKQAILLEPGNLIVIAARPSVGKTAFALNIAHHISVVLNGVVGFFSLEMSHQQIAERILSYCCEVSVEDLRRGNFSKEKLLSIKETEEFLLTKHFFICDKNISTIDQIIGKAEGLAKKYPLSIIFIDYLQLISAENKNENRQNEIANVSMQLKSLAKNLNIPVVCLSQLSRKVEDRTDKRPVMSDLRDSGQIEQDADAILLLYNKDHHHSPNNNVNVMDVFLCKNRHGPTLSFRLNFTKSFGSFSLCDHNW
ncbi:DnaB helicase C-terminal domain-containing protein [Candidatus Clavichlamydia salmonicola]|uniref:DnaB helicase C-terminal domain-containing protein n=1 Tax=Candidatus Clavichlamydia salmonicola TaxID=469812 RepID=UPI001890D258|nr:DnaB helicase C-terminal domain-containing protein [Candidatus Clavichlamydia salmonicola]